MSHNSDNWPLSVKKVTNISRLTVGIILVIAALSIPMKFKVKNIFKSTFWQSNIEYSDTWGRYIPALIGWRKGGNVTSAGWQVTLCDPIWHVSSCSGAVLVAQTAIRFLTLTYLYWFTSKFIFSRHPLFPKKIPFQDWLALFDNVFSVGEKFSFSLTENCGDAAVESVWLLRLDGVTWCVRMSIIPNSRRIHHPSTAKRRAAHHTTPLSSARAGWPY